ncbi:MAG TPA: hypothetical protein VEI02_11190 [Planctomycetota bacterium]|nr:hypothetical protein [Planctomycetota bacterium]
MALAAACGGQSAWLAATDATALWRTASGRVCVHAGPSVIAFDGAAATPTVVDRLTLPRGVRLFDAGDDGAAFVFDDALEHRPRVGAPRRVALEGPPWPGATAPLRAPLLLADGRIVAPTPSSTRVLAPSEGVAPSAVDLGAARRRRTATWGLAGVAEDVIAAPYVFALGAAGGGGLVYGTPGAWARRAAAGADAALPPVDLDERSKIDVFEASVPPVVGDFDGDGAFELVRVDPGGGVVVVQGGLDRAALPPPRPILLGGPCLAARVDDANGDGRDDLVALKAPPLGAAQKLSVLAEGRLRATALVYAGGPGGLGRTPETSVEVSLGVTLRVRDGERSARVVTLAAPAGRGRFLVADPGAAPRVVGAGVEEAPATAFEATPDGAWIDPLGAVRVGDAVFALLAGADGTRLIRFAPPQPK